MHPRVLLIAYHFPPAGGSGVRRTFAYARYLRDHGWEPLILTGSHKTEAVSTKNLNEMLDGVQVYRSASPYLPSALSIKGRYPDFLAWPEGRLPWWFTGVPRALSIVRQHKPAVVWCTYPIPTALLIGLTVRRLTGLPLVADLRDAMTDDKFPLEPRRRQIYRWIEKRVCRGADRVVFTTDGTRDMYRQRFPGIPDDNWRVLPNGYDEDLFDGAPKPSRSRGKKKVLLHSGLIYPSERDPSHFFAAVKRLLDEGKVSADRLEIRLRSPGQADMFQGMSESLGIEQIIRIEPPIDYREALAEMLTVDGLLVLQGASCNHQIPAKVYEYFRAGTPILGLTDPAGDTGRLMSEFGVRRIANLDNPEDIAEALLGFLADIDGQLHRSPPSEALQAYSRRTQAGDLAKLLAEVSAPKMEV